MSIEVRARGNLSIIEKDALVGEVEDIIANVEGISAMYTNVSSGGGGGGGGPFSNSAAADSIGNISLELKY